MPMSDIFPESYRVVVDSQPIAESNRPVEFTLVEAIERANKCASSAECHSAVLSWEGVVVYQALLGAGERIREYREIQSRFASRTAAGMAA